MQTKIQSSPLPASGKGVQVSDDQIEQLRSVLARTYEKASAVPRQARSSHEGLDRPSHPRSPRPESGNINFEITSFRKGERVDRVRDPRQCFLSFERLIAPRPLEHIRPWRSVPGMRPAVDLDVVPFS